MTPKVSASNRPADPSFWLFSQHSPTFMEKWTSSVYSTQKNTYHRKKQRPNPSIYSDWGAKTILMLKVEFFALDRCFAVNSWLRWAWPCPYLEVINSRQFYCLHSIRATITSQCWNFDFLSILQISSQNDIGSSNQHFILWYRFYDILAFNLVQYIIIFFMYYWIRAQNVELCLKGSKLTNPLNPDSKE